MSSSRGSGESGSLSTTLLFGYLWQHEDEITGHPAHPRLPHRSPAPHFVGQADVLPRLIASGCSSSTDQSVPTAARSPRSTRSPSITSRHAVASRPMTDPTTWSWPAEPATRKKRTNPCSPFSWPSAPVACFSPTTANTCRSRCWTWRARPLSGPCRPPRVRN